MADASAILAVSEAIRSRLQAELSLVSILPSQIFIESIDLLPDPVPPPRVTIFLYSIKENELLKNRQHEVVPVPPPGSSVVVPPPMVLDLEYMICAWGSTTQDEHLLLGDVARVLYDAPELEPTALGPTWRPEERVQLSLHNMSIEDQARIWTTFGFRRFKLALYYRARVVPIRSERFFSETLVRERDLGPRRAAPPQETTLPREVP